MPVINIKTITPVHVGSGVMLLQNADFVTRGEDIGVKDDQKILKHIGDNNVNNWIASIEQNEDALKFVKRFSKDATLASISSRIIQNYAQDSLKTKQLKEQLHDGLGRPYIPGSSIKGAIRTALLTSVIDQFGLKNDVANPGRFMANPIESYYFGKDPKESVFRFLRVGDAYFNSGTTLSQRMINLNIRGNSSFIDGSKPALVEAIMHDEESSFRLDIADAQLKLAARKQKVDAHFVESCFKDVSSLFETINAHTMRLVKEEMSFWKDYVDEDGVEEYIDWLDQILIDVEECKKGSQCVLRIGHGSGWTFMTGGWAKRKMSPPRFEQVVEKARPSNYKYKDMPFPKSRRVDDEDLNVLGFVKLSIVE